MPTVRNYGVPKVETAALPGVRATAAPTAEGLGAGIGDQVARVGALLYQDELLRQDQVATMEADRKLSEWELKRLYDPREGALAKRGKDTFGLPDQVTKEFDETLGEIRKGLTTDRQRVAFDRHAETRRRDINGALTRHVFSEVRKHDDAETENYLLNSRQSAVKAAATGDLGRVAVENERQIAAVTDYANRNGLGPEYTKQKIAQVKSDTHVGVVESLLAAGQDITAKQYAEKVRGEIAGDDIAKVDKWLLEGNVRGESQRQADQIMRTSKSREEALAQAQKIDDPKIRDSVEERVNRYWSLKKQADNERREQTMIDAANIIDKTGSVDRIAPSVWTGLTVSERTALEQYAKRKQAGTEGKTDFGTYYTLVTLASAPETRDAFARTNLMQYLPKLGKSEFKHLVDLQASIRKGDGKAADKMLSSDRVQNQIVNDAVLSIGLDPTPNEKTPKQVRDKVIEFRRVVREQVGSLEQRTGKQATDADVQGIVDNLIVKGRVPGTGWFRDDERHVFEIKEGENLIVKPADVPKSERRKIEEALRRQGRAVTDEAVVTLYTANIMRQRGVAPKPAAPSMVDQVPR